MSFIRYFLILIFIRKDYPLKFKMQTFKIKDYFLNVKFSSLKLKKNLFKELSYSMNVNVKHCALTFEEKSLITKD